MSASASAGRCWLCRWVGPPPPVAQRCDYRCSCADGVGRVSLECLSSERDAVVPEGAWPSRRARALAAALTLFFKVTSEGGAFRRMCGSLIKCCSLPRLMGQIAHYAGLYIMSNCLLLSLPANEPSSYTPGRKTKIWTVSLQQEGLEVSGIVWFRSSLCNFSFVAHSSDDTPSILGMNKKIWGFTTSFSQCASPASFTNVPSKFKVLFNSIPGLVFAPLLLSFCLLVHSAAVNHLCLVSSDVKVACSGPWGGTSAANLVSSRAQAPLPAPMIQAASPAASPLTTLLAHPAVVNDYSRWEYSDSGWQTLHVQIIALFSQITTQSASHLIGTAATEAFYWVGIPNLCVGNGFISPARYWTCHVTLENICENAVNKHNSSGFKDLIILFSSEKPVVALLCCLNQFSTSGVWFFLSQ